MLRTTIGSLWLCVLACSSGPTPISPPSPSSASSELEARVSSDRLAPGDLVDIRVFREDELNGTHAVAADGTIVFPLIGQVVVADKDPQSAAAEIKARLEDGYLREAFVSVLVRQRSSLNVHVMGQVKQSGTFSFRPGMTLIEAITTAGGFTALAAKNSVRVTRTADGREDVFELRAGDIGEGKASNFELRPGDIVNVPEALF